MSQKLIITNNRDKHYLLDDEIDPRKSSFIKTLEERVDYFAYKIICIEPVLMIHVCEINAGYFLFRCENCKHFWTFSSRTKLYMCVICSPDSKMEEIPESIRDLMKEYLKDNPNTFEKNYRKMLNMTEIYFTIKH